MSTFSGSYNNWIGDYEKIMIAQTNYLNNKNANK